jgi:hypothetical protein
MEKRVSFSVPDIVNVEVESFTNPVTGEEQDTKNTDTKRPLSGNLLEEQNQR